MTSRSKQMARIERQLERTELILQIEQLSANLNRATADLRTAQAQLSLESHRADEAERRARLERYERRYWESVGTKLTHDLAQQTDETARYRALAAVLLLGKVLVS